MTPAKEIQGATCVQHRGPQFGPIKSYVPIINDSQHRMCTHLSPQVKRRGPSPRRWPSTDSSSFNPHQTRV